MAAEPSLAPMGSISSFTLHHRAGYSAFVRAMWTVPCLVDLPGQTLEVRETERLGPAINLGRDEMRSLKGLDIPSGAEVQMVLELVAAGNPRVIASEVWRFLPGSFRTATYKARGTIFDPKLELDVSKPRVIAIETPSCDEKRMLVTKPETESAEPTPPSGPSLFCCL